MKNYYEILEVNEHASEEVIDKAYKVLIEKYNSDLYENTEKEYAQQKVKDINEAYKVLSDAFIREQYDVELQKVKNEEFLKRQKINNKSDEPEKNNKKSKFENILNNIRNTNDTSNTSNTNNTYNRENIYEPKREKKNKIGSFSATFGILVDIFKNRPKGIKLDKITKIDLIAFILTIVIIVILGIILWFIPFTNGWMRQLLFENPLFNWIGSLF